MSETAGPVIHHDAAAQQFLVEVDGHRAELDYVVEAGVLRIVHTGVPPAIGGRGLAGNLVRNAVAFARAQGYKVRPDCSYAAAWFQRHPEQQELMG